MIAIDSISHRGGDENRRCQQFLGSMLAAEVIRGQDPNQQRNAANADERDGIRQVHCKPIYNEIRNAFCERKTF
jgi:hypothetical protein